MGNLDGWVERLEARARELALDPRTMVTFYLAPPIEEERLASLAAEWGVDAFEPAIRNLYSQANGVCFLWIATHHPSFPSVKKRWLRRGYELGAFGRKRLSFDKLPTTFHVDQFHERDASDGEDFGEPTWGAIYLPPLQDVLRGLFPIPEGPSGSRTVGGYTWDGPEFERSLRVFDYPSDENPAALVMRRGEPAPRVVLARDHRAFDEGSHACFADYLEHVLGTYGTVAERKGWFEGRPDQEATEPRSLPLREVLPPSVALQPAEDAATFEIEVEAVEASGGAEGRVAMLRRLIPSHRVKEVAKALALKPLNRSNDALLLEIAAATEDPKIDSKLARKLMGAANQTEKTKKAYLAAFAVGSGDGGGGEQVTLQVTTCFDLSSMSVAEVDRGLADEDVAKAWLAEIGGNAAAEALGAVECRDAEGTKARTATVVLTLRAVSGLEPGAKFRAHATPAGYRATDDGVFRLIG